MSTRYQSVDSIRPQRETWGSRRSTVASAVVALTVCGKAGIDSASARLSFAGGAASAVPGTANSISATNVSVRMGSSSRFVVATEFPEPLTLR